VNDAIINRIYVTLPVSWKCNFACNQNEDKKSAVMGSLLYIIAVILIVAWAIGFFAYSAGSVIHILLVIALIAVILRIIRGKRII
jgi:tryptophan-rich sensory protein